MSRRIALVKNKDDAFKLGLSAESIDPSLQDSSKYDAFIVSEPGVPAMKIPRGEVLDNIMSIQHHYSNLQGKMVINYKKPANIGFRYPT